MNSAPLKNTASNKKYVNTSSVQANNVSGVTGVSWKRGKLRWVATIQFNGKFQHLGDFQICEDAIAIRKVAEQAYDILIEAGATAIDFTKKNESNSYSFSAMIATDEQPPLRVTVEGAKYVS